MKKYLEPLRFAIAVITILLLIAFSFIITYKSSKLDIYSAYIIVCGIISLVLYIISKIKNLKFNIYEVLIIFLTILSLLSLLGAINIDAALFGSIGRYEGLFVILSYYFIFLNAMSIKNEKHIKWLILLIIIFIIFNSIYGLIQTGFLNNFSFDIRNSSRYAKGLQGNSMGYGALLSIGYSIILGLFLKEKKLVFNITWFILLILVSFGLIISGCMAAYVGVVIVLILVLIESIIEIVKRKNYMFLIKFILSIVVLFTSFMLCQSKVKRLKKDVIETTHEITNVSKGKVKDVYGTGRIYIWRNVSTLVIKYPFTGVGIDNIRYAFDDKLKAYISGKTIDKAHNEYLQKYACEGIFSGTAYLFLLLLIFFKNIFKTKSKWHYALLLGYSAYSIQAFFGISVTRVSPIYFIVAGLIISYEPLSNNKCNVKIGGIK